MNTLKIGFSIILFVGFTRVGQSQIRSYPANSLQESYMMLANVHGIDGNRYYPQNPEEMKKAWGLRTHDTAENVIDILLNYNRVKYAKDYFQNAHPELSGVIPLTPRLLRWTKRIGEKSLFKYPSEFYSWHDSQNPKTTYFVLNPIVNTEFGPQSSISQGFMTNAKGIEFFGRFNKNVSFTTQALEGVSYLKGYDLNYRRSFGFVPGVALAVRKIDTADMFKARASIYINLMGNESGTRKIQLAFGNDNNFIGYGYRSLILSNFSPATTYLKLIYKLGPFRYQNLFQQMEAYSVVKKQVVLERKYLALHRATLDIAKPGNPSKKDWLEIGVTETILQGRTNGQLDLNYLNPIIFYRSIERDLGSPDNVMISLDAKLKLKKGFLYSQLLLDEFRYHDLIRGNSRYNKFGVQFGGYCKLLDNKRFGSLVINGEYNKVRPYTYSHYSRFSNAANYNQSITHPLESNFREGIFQLKFKPSFVKGLLFTSTNMLAKKGFDFTGDSTNYGANLRLNYSKNSPDPSFATMFQGDVGTIFHSKSQLYYELMPNMWMYLGYQYRKQTGHNPSTEKYIFLGFRWNWYEEQQLF